LRELRRGVGKKKGVAEKNCLGKKRRGRPSCGGRKDSVEQKKDATDDERLCVEGGRGGKSRGQEGRGVCYRNRKLGT